MRRRGFTIVELLMVIGIIAVLMGIVTTAASESMKAARQRRADAMCKLVQAGFSNFYAQYDRWPGSFGQKVESKSLGTRNNDEGRNGNSDNEEYVLTCDEVRQCIKEMIDETKKGSPVMDISGLFVSSNTSEPTKESCDCKSDNHYRYSAPRGGGGVATGLDFWSAVHGTAHSKRRMSTGSMAFGYPHPVTGRFMPFKVVYSIPTDSITVTKWHWPGAD